ncbi:hypothetical protein HID58_053534 [Brassica napus]|uniref:Uncharacterized protein n=1 Tax=Brassica napus TaxID=3708 RepID=A0ABQ8AEZ2_BRANA|nr:hypothetical protein HID58_053534 [Brassica napus]
MIKPNVKDDAKLSSSSPSFLVTEQNVQRSCKASAMSTTRSAHYPETSNRFKYLVHSPIIAERSKVMQSECNEYDKASSLPSNV